MAKIINHSDADIETARQSFAQQGFVVVPNFLHAAYAVRIREGLLHHSMQKHFHHAAQLKGHHGTAYLANVPKNLPKIVAHRAAAAARGAPHLCYSFLRTDVMGRTSGTQTVRALVESEEFLALVRRITGLPANSVETMFASQYVTGDFLDAHTDEGGPRRQLAFVLNLSMEWREDMGGNLVFDDAHTLVPRFNTLVLFDVRGKGRNHKVTTVTAEADDARLAVSGWLQS